MQTFSEFMELKEKLMVFGRSAYPKFGNVVILAGGAASGKGFTLSNLIGVEGKIFDVDSLKLLASKAPRFSSRVREETGHDISSFDLRNPDNVGKLHDILADVYGVTKKHQAAMFGSILASDSTRKPNLIFDVTLKDVAKLESITRNVSDLGYDKRNIHVVWVINSIDVAISQNLTRSRTVPEEILMSTHEGAALTFKKILDMGDKLKKYMDGVIFLSFNQAKVDSTMAKSDKGGSYVVDANYVKVKEQGKPQQSSSELSSAIVDKIIEYTPKVDVWR